MNPDMESLGLEGLEAAQQQEFIKAAIQLLGATAAADAGVDEALKRVTTQELKDEAITSFIIAIRQLRRAGISVADALMSIVQRPEVKQNTDDDETSPS